MAREQTTRPVVKTHQGSTRKTDGSHLPVYVSEDLSATAILAATVQELLVKTMMFSTPYANVSSERLLVHLLFEKLVPLCFEFLRKKW